MASFLDNMFKDKRVLLLIIFFALLIFSPGLFNFFASDDWFHLNVSRVFDTKEFLNFFSFVQTSQSTPFYRPLSTQVFFFFFQTIFGLNPLPYHIFIFSLFALNLYLIFKLGLFIFKDKYPSLVSVFIYAFSATNFVRLYYISVVQEVLMLTFLLLSLLTCVKNTKPGIIYSLAFFVLALISKETAVVLPLILLAYEILKNKKINPGKTVPFFLIIIPYLLIRYYNLGEGVVSSYIFDFSLRKLLNTLSWYFLWSLGVPELLVDYVSSGFRILPRFYTDFPTWSKIILPTLLAALLSFVVLLLKNIKHLGRNFILGVIIFIIGLLPVIFLPTHKFTLQLTLPMVGFSLLVGCLYRFKAAAVIFIAVFAILNLLTNLLTYQTHYSVSRSRISHKVFNYFAANYPKKEAGNYFEFTNDTPDFGRAWGGSKQISQVSSNSDLFKVLYKDRTYKVYFADFTNEIRPEGNRINISTKMLLNY